ncbi:MAG: efflux RND transporter periplasmic adaptor subunit [Phycisphaerales bacterium]|nr:efflux RND transporter periplasmic adaptor subunit [Phycisphaerales bacterium]
MKSKRSTNARSMSHVVAVVVFFCAVCIAGCDRSSHSEGDGHDHGESTAGDQHAPHDSGHGHDHGSPSVGTPEQATDEGDEHAHSAAEEGAHLDEVTLAADAVDRYGITIARAQTRILEHTFVAPARVGFNIEAMAHVGSPLSGRAVEIKVRLGSLVSEGDDLVIVESPELGQAQSDFLIKRAAAQAAVPAVELAKTAWDRALGLYEKSEGIALTEVQRREGEYKAALAVQQSAQAAATAAENYLHILGMKQREVEALILSGEIDPRFTIHAPLAGQVVEREVTLGELVSPDREKLLVIADTRVLWVLADVPEARVHEVQVGARAWVTVGTVGSQAYEGQVAFISPLVDPTTRTAQVRIEVPASEVALKPGMFAQVEIVSTGSGGEMPAAVIAVPEEAIQVVEGGPAVFVPVEGEANTFAKRAVSIGRTVGGLVPIHSGLADGESFVASGSFILKAELGKGSAAHEH